MKTPPPLLSKALRLAAVATVAAFVPVGVDAQIKAYDTYTPAWIDFEVAELSVGEGQSASLTVHRYGDCRDRTVVDYSSVEGTASAGNDYRSVGGTLVFQPGETRKTIELTTIADDLPEGELNFFVELRGQSSGTVVVTERATVKISEISAFASAPAVQIRRETSGQVIISWEGDPGFVLERTTQINGGSWEPVPEAITDGAYGFEVLQNADTGHSFFYRLERKQAP